MRLEAKKKKERTAEQKVKRGKFALLFILVLVFVIIVFPSKKNTDKVTDPNERIVMEMDRVLDSLVRDIIGEGAEVFFKGELEDVPVIPECPEEEDLAAVELKIRMLENKNIPAENREAAYEEALDEKAYLERKIEEFNDSAASKIVYQSRRIRFRTPDGAEYTCFQQHFASRDRLKHLVEITKGADAQKEYDAMQNQIQKELDDSLIDER